jgi:group I intron endonuclease
MALQSILNTVEEIKVDKYSCGIYRIVNIRTGDMYIGSTNNFDRRKGEHFTNLERGKHNDNLQPAYDGEENKQIFVFEPVAIYPEDLLKAIEQHFLDVLQPAYNVSKSSTSPKGRVWTKEAREEHGEIVTNLQRGKIPYQLHTPQARAKSSATKSARMKGKLPVQMHTATARKKAAETNSKVKKGVHTPCPQLHTPQTVAKRAATHSLQRKGIVVPRLNSPEAMEKKRATMKANLQHRITCSWYCTIMKWTRYWGS